MRKFSIRWWAGPDLEQWKMDVACGDYCDNFFVFPMVLTRPKVWVDFAYMTPNYDKGYYEWHGAWRDRYDFPGGFITG